ncbi:hypothetical protein [Streptomyces sp. C184]|uniref:hypothetical protein n=1 Tax=Streptomyces sp. C184 TaxID=3237121 RepID=UPI0034C5CC5D
MAVDQGKRRAFGFLDGVHRSHRMPLPEPFAAALSTGSRGFAIEFPYGFPAWRPGPGAPAVQRCPGRTLCVRVASIGAAEPPRKNQSTATASTYLRSRFTAEVIPSQGFRYRGRSGEPDQEFLSISLWTFCSTAAQNPCRKARKDCGFCPERRILRERSLHGIDGGFFSVHFRVAVRVHGHADVGIAIAIAIAIGIGIGIGIGIAIGIDVHVHVHVHRSP